ncbi:MAG TPA: hypothetical protein VI790_04050 [Candidatus Nanoarchaeia archaeon]|nr:hypothetical protein [Candidatus Nanoarchaeia archaeon]
MSYVLTLTSKDSTLESVYSRLNEGAKLVSELLWDNSFSDVSIVDVNSINAKNPILMMYIDSVKNGKNFRVTVKCSCKGLFCEEFNALGKLEKALSDF